MSARVVKYKVKLDRWDDALSALRSMVSTIEKIDGLVSWTNVADPETGTGTAISIFESDEARTAANPTLRKILSELSAYFDVTPTVETADILNQIQIKQD